MGRRWSGWVGELGGGGKREPGTGKRIRDSSDQIAGGKSGARCEIGERFLIAYGS
jgi:hypothetical protein